MNLNFAPNNVKAQIRNVAGALRREGLYKVIQ